MIKKLRVLIVDDHELVCGGIRHFLSTLAVVSTIEAVGTIRDAKKILKLEQTDLVLLDIKLPDGMGSHLLQEIKQHTPSVTVIIISGQMTAVLVRELMALGADGLFDKSDPTEGLKDTVDSVMEGAFYASCSVVGLLNSPSANIKLSPRQKQMLQYLAEGKTNKDIANLLGLSQATVSFHLSELRGKLNCKSSREIVGKAEQLGLLSGY